MKQKKEPHVRFSISLPPLLLKQLDAMMVEKGREMVEHQSQKGDKEMAGTITIVYDHHTPHIQSQLTEIQHDLHECILSTTHVHLTHESCLEVLIVRGKANEIRSISDRIFACKGIKHGKLTITAFQPEY